jgi:hypothetical protein
MANVKISALPVADNLWNLDEILPIVDSGSTTTSKRTYGSLFSNHSGGTYTITATDQTWAVIASGSDSPATHVRIGGINNAAVISSRGAEISSGQMNTIIGSEQQNDSNQPKINGGQYNTIIGSKPNGSQLEINGANYSVLMGLENGYINGGQHGLIAASNNHQLGYADKTATLATQGGYNYGSRAFMAGCEGFTINSNMTTALASYAGTLNGNLYQFSIGSYIPTVDGLSGAQENAGHIGTRESTVSHQAAGMYHTSGRTSLHSYTSHHDGVHIFKNITKSTSTGNTASGAVTIDLSTHPVYEFELTGDVTAINFTNSKEGGEYIFIVYNNASWTITSSGVTLGGVAGTCFAKGGSINPTNSGYSKYRLVIVDGKGWLDEELNFSAM